MYLLGQKNWTAKYYHGLSTAPPRVRPPLDTSRRRPIGCKAEDHGCGTGGEGGQSSAGKGGQTQGGAGHRRAERVGEDGVRGQGVLVGHVVLGTRGVEAVVNFCLGDLRRD